jgi:glucokinase
VQGARAVGLDIGGTKLAGGLVAADGTVLHRHRLATPATDTEQVLETITEMVSTLQSVAGDRTLPVGIGAAGIIGLDGTVRYAPNIAWVDYPLRELLEKRVGGPVLVDNDANVAAWGEYSCGAGRAARSSMAMLTVGTGVGGGLVDRGALVRGASGFGAELGHLIVIEGGPPCPCGNRGCLEAVASGNAIGRAATEALAAGAVPTDSSLHGLETITGKTVTAAAQAGDTCAIELVAGVGFWLGVGIASVVNALDPEMVVIGGGGMNAGELLLGPARVAAQERILGGGPAGRDMPPVVAATLGDDAGVVGAALLALAAVGSRR